MKTTWFDIEQEVVNKSLDQEKRGVKVSVKLETADIALMADKLETLPFATGLSRKAKSVIKQNLWVSLGVVALLIPATIMSWASIGIAVAIHEGSTLIVVINALRLLGYKNR